MRQQIVDIHNAQNQFDQLSYIRRGFHDFVGSTGTTNKLPNPLKVDSESFSTHCFGHDLVAKPRVVRSQTGDFFLEYLFCAGQGDERVPVCAFYLSSNGVVYSDLNSVQQKLSDFNNHYLGERLLTYINLAALGSALFLPRADNTLFHQNPLGSSA